MVRGVHRSVAAVIVLVTAGSLTAYAQPRFLRQFTSKYPHVANTKLGDCATCHAKQPGSLNAYGKALRDSTLRFAAVERLDSDRDGVSNVKEIEAHTFPGDPGDTPGRKPKGDKSPPDSLSQALTDSAAKSLPDSSGARPTPPDTAKGGP
jgi:hypothetical protein